MKLVCSNCGGELRYIKDGAFLHWYCKKCKQEVEPIRKSKYVREDNNE